MIYLISGIVIWIICGIASYYVIRAAFLRNGKDYKYVEAWSKEDATQCVIFSAVAGPIHLIAAILFYFMS